jgi:hypothetical protein
MQTRKKRLLGVLAALLLAGACSEHEQPPPDPCLVKWQTLVNFDRDSGDITDLAWHAGTLYFSVVRSPVLTGGLPSEIRAMATTGGPTSVVATDWAFRLWVEGESLLYLQHDQVLSVPLVGGTPVKVLDGRTCIAAPNACWNPRLAALDATHFYWARPDEQGLGVFRLARSGGAAEPLARLSNQSDLLALTLAEDAVILASFEGDAWAVPRNGGETRQFASRVGFRVGAGHGAVLWQRAPSDERAFDHEMLRSTPGDTAPERFWPDMAPRFEPSSAWPAGDGAWVIVGNDHGAAGGRKTFWRLDAAGRASRLACAPEGNEPLDVRAVALAPDAVYAVVEVLDSPPRWMIVRVPSSAP